MDRTINSPLTLGTRSPFSPRVRQKGPKTPLLKKSSRFSASGKSVQTAHIVLKSPLHTAERYGNTLPVIITEALTFADRNTVVSVRISECGYAWLVCGRRLLVWQYRQVGGTPQRRAQGGLCHELTLPQSDLAHRADLVSVFTTPGLHTPACIAVSPEGVIRYWPNVSHEGVSVEHSVELQGQECDSVCALEGGGGGGGVCGCVVATTTCSVVFVQARLSPAARHELHTHTLRAHAGWFGGIGKRVSSMFAPITSELTAEPKLVRVLSVREPGECWGVWMLAGHSLQRWLLCGTEPEQLLAEVKLERCIKEAYHCTAWPASASDLTDIVIWLLDVQVIGNEVMILAAAVNLPVDTTVHYAIVRLDANALQNKDKPHIEEFLLLKLFAVHEKHDSSSFLSYKLLLCGNSVYVHRPRDITIVQPGNELDVLDFSAIGDKILGGSVCNNTAVFFSRNHGLVAVYPNEQVGVEFSRSMVDVSIEADMSRLMNESVGMGVSPNNLTLYNIDPEEMITAQRDTISQMKAAFLFHIKNQQQSCEEILSELFPEEGEVVNEIDGALDVAVVGISEELLDDAPVGDPRWLASDVTATIPAGLGSSSAMQIQHQLTDKQQAHYLFLHFLQQRGLWTRMSAISVSNSVLATLHVLADHAELLVAAIQLRSLTSTSNQLLQDAIEYGVNELYEIPRPGLSKQDVFYREVTKTHRGLWALVEKCVQATAADTNPTQLVTIISETNNILLTVLGTVMQFRQQKATFFSPAVSVTQLPIEYLPWTINTGEQGLYDALQKQQSVTLRYGARVCTEGATRASLYDQYVSLVDVMLDARKCHVESIRGTNSQQTQRADLLRRQYQQERHKLIQPLVDDREWERAALLAEKYLDFTTLVVICEGTNNQQRLDEYLERFKDEDFAQHVFNWYLREGKQAKLLARCRAGSRPTSSSSSLTHFLGAHPQLNWLQYAFQGDYNKTAFALRSLAAEEREFLTRKKNMLSFAKLSSLVANGITAETEFVEDVNKELELIQCQEELPDEVLSAFGYDTVCQPVLDTVTLTQLCVCTENHDATEYDFKKALDLCTYVTDDEQRHQVVMHVWKAAILRDNTWHKQRNTQLESPIELLRHTMFFKLADLAITLGSRPDEVLPPIDLLLNDSDLGTIKEDKNFQYLIKVAYDYFFRSQDFGDTTYRP